VSAVQGQPLGNTRIGQASRREGLVVARQGQGTTVQSVDQWNLLDPLVLDAYIRNDRSLTIYDDLMEVRAALEGQMARRAAMTMSESQLEELHSRLQVLESLLNDPDLYTEADIAYHDLINRYSGHLLARSILRTVQPIALANAYYGRTHRSLEDNLRSHHGHAAIYEEISNRNPEGRQQRWKITFSVRGKPTSSLSENRNQVLTEGKSWYSSLRRMNSDQRLYPVFKQ